MVNILYNYEQYLSIHYLESTKKTYLSNVKLYLKFLKEYKGKADIITVCNVNKADIYNYIAYMDKQSKKTKEIKLVSIKNFYSFLNRNLSDYLFEDIKLFNLNKKLPRYLTSLQIRTLINYYSNKEKKLIIILFISTGIRLSELLSIETSKIYLKEKYFIVKKKGGGTRKVYFNEQIKELLRGFLKKDGKLIHYKRRTVQEIVKKAMKELEIKGSVHSLRHTFATQMYRYTKDILIVKELLGHRSIEATQIYTHLENDLIKDAVEKNPLANFKVGGEK